jgi:hypothetical protein
MNLKGKSLNLRYKVTRQAKHVQRNIEARSCNHCCSGKAISITHSECVFVALGIQHAMRMHYFRFKHDVTAEWAAPLLLIPKVPLSNLARLRGWIGFSQSIFRWVGYVARKGRGEMHTSC